MYEMQVLRGWNFRSARCHRARSHFNEENVTRGKENKMDLSIKYIGAILRFIVKRVSKRITLREMRFLRALLLSIFPLLSAQHERSEKWWERGEGAKGILDPWLLTFRKSLSSIISRGSCFPDVAGKLRQTWSCIYVLRVCTCMYSCTYVTCKVTCVFIRVSYNTKLHIMWHARDTSTCGQVSDKALHTDFGISFEFCINLLRVYKDTVLHTKKIISK